MYLLSLGSSNLFAKSMCLLLWCLLMSKATFGYLLGYIKASKSKLHQSKYSPRTHCGLTHIMYYVCNAASFCAMHFDHFVIFFIFFSFLQFLEKVFFTILRKIFFTILGKPIFYYFGKTLVKIHRKKFFKFWENVF